MPFVQFVVPLAPSELRMPRIDNHHHVTIVLVGRKCGLVFSLQGTTSRVHLDAAERMSTLTSRTQPVHACSVLSVRHLQNDGKLRSKAANELALGVHQSIAEPSRVNVLHRMQISDIR